MDFYEVPAAVLEDPEELARWATKTHEVARRKGSPAKSGDRGRKR